jgi:hypothetical protein
MAHICGLELFHLKYGKELVLAEPEKGVTLAAVELFEIENVFVKRDGLLDVIHLDRNMIASVNLHAHFRSLAEKEIVPAIVFALHKIFLLHPWFAPICHL